MKRLAMYVAAAYSLAAVPMLWNGVPWSQDSVEYGQFQLNGAKVDYLVIKSGEKIKALDTYKDRLVKATTLFDSCLAKAKKDHWGCEKDISLLDEAGKLVFSCFFSAYQYRNKFVHKGIPFPSVVKDSYGVEEDSGIAYISPVLAMSFPRFNRPKTGWQEGDEIDIHEIIGDEAPKFKETYFFLIPTWYFLKKLAKKAILNKIYSL